MLDMCSPLVLPQNVFVPREVVWLNGAPGAGKVRPVQGAAQAPVPCATCDMSHDASAKCHVHGTTIHTYQLVTHWSLFQGVNTVHILKTRGLDNDISLSDLLVSHTIRGGTFGVQAR